MADQQAKIYNEKLKGIALMFRNAALVAGTAGAARWYSDGIGIIVGVLLASASTAAYMGVQLLSLMQPED